MEELNESIKDGPDIIGGNRDSDGRFSSGISGNPSGRPKGRFSITTIVKQELEKIPEGQSETYLSLMVHKLIEKALDGDYKILRMIWDHIDGYPKESIDVSEKEPTYYIITHGEGT